VTGGVHQEIGNPAQLLQPARLRGATADGGGRAHRNDEVAESARPVDRRAPVQRTRRRSMARLCWPAAASKACAGCFRWPRARQSSLAVPAGTGQSTASGSLRQPDGFDQAIEGSRSPWRRRRPRHEAAHALDQRRARKMGWRAPAPLGEAASKAPASAPCSAWIAGQSWPPRPCGAARLTRPRSWAVRSYASILPEIDSGGGSLGLVSRAQRPPGPHPSPCGATVIR